mgnify:CR=1 FL=1
MGFLRKVAKKVKKRFKKLFSSKLALGMILGPAIGKAFNGIKGFFGGAGAGTTAATTTTATTTGAATTGAATTGAATTGATTEAVTSTATEGIISDSVTGAMEKVVNNEALSNDLLLQAQKGLKGEIPKPSKFTVSDITVAKPSPLPKPTLGQEIGNKFADFGTGVKDFASDPFGKTKEYVGGDFIPDVARSVGQQYVMGALQGEPDVRTAGFGRMPQVGSMEASQDAYLQEIRTQMPNLQATNFQQLNQSLLYGTLSPQYLMGQMG